MRGVNAFVAQQDSFQFNSRGKPTQPAARSDQPMTGDNDGQRIFIGCLPHRPGQVRITQPASELTVGKDMAEFDLTQSQPHPFLKLGASHT